MHLYMAIEAVSEALVSNVRMLLNDTTYLRQKVLKQIEHECITIPIG